MKQNKQGASNQQEVGWFLSREADRVMVQNQQFAALLQCDAVVHCAWG